MGRSGEREGEAGAEGELIALMARYQAGEAEAFEVLYAKLAGPLRGYLRRMAPLAPDVEDLVQTTFLQLHRARASHQPGRPVRPWLYAIARHVALMDRRGAGRRAKHETLAPAELPEVPVAARDSQVLDRLTLERALGEIGDAGREAAWLHHVEGLSFREVAAVQGVTETAAKVRAHRALVALRERLAGERG